MYRQAYATLFEEYLTWLEAQNFSDDTIVTRRTTIGYFIDWAHAGHR